MSILDKFKNFGRKPDDSGVAFKALGNGKWIAQYTNNFLDRDFEAFSLKAHKEFVERVDNGLVPLPELRFYHHKDLVIGQSTKLFQLGHGVYAMGTFHDNPLARAVEKYAMKNPTALSLSHGFYFPDWGFDGKVYSAYNTFEVTVLPRGKEANPFTAFMAIEEETDMPVNDEIKQHITTLFGDEKGVIEWVESRENAEKGIASVAESFKDFADTSILKDTPAAPAPSALPDSLVLGAILEGQAESANQIATFADAVKALIDHAKKQSAALETITAELESVKASQKSIKERLALAPRGVEDAPEPSPVNIPNVLELAKAAQVIEAQNQPGQEFDPFYAAVGLKVPKR